MATLYDISVPFTRLMDGMQLSYDSEASSATSKFWVAPADVPRFIDDCRGKVEILGGPGGYVSRRVPLLLPEDPRQYVVGATVDFRGGFGKPKMSKFNKAYEVYTNAFVTLSFRTLPFALVEGSPAEVVLAGGDAGESAWISIEERSAPTEYTVPGKKYQFADGVRGEQDMAIRVPEQQLLLTVHWVPDVVAARNVLFPFLGTANQDAFLGRLPGTVLFEGFDTGAQISSYGNLAQDIKLSLRYRPIPWDYAFHPKKLKWQLLSDPSGNPIVPRTDLTSVVRI